MADFAKALPTLAMAAAYFDRKQVVDQTELEGAWDFEFKYSPPYVGPRPPHAIDLFEAVSRQLGLKLDNVEVPQSIWLIDNIMSKPSANPPGAAEILNVMTGAEFEYASVKHTGPQERKIPLQIQRGGRVVAIGVSLRSLIEQAWNVTDETLVGAPKWLDEDLYDIEAKESENGAPLDIDMVWLMVRSLLKDRFNLKVHTEDQKISAYTLLASRPKLHPADKTQRTALSQKVGLMADGNRTGLSVIVTARNVTMRQFAERLQGFAAGYIHSPVLDATGLGGAWDFTLNFSAPRRPASSSGASDIVRSSPSGLLSETEPANGLDIFQAVEKQLGLRLKLEKRPVPVLVIDRINRTLVAN
jgi:uncharacterized protein (TIGR03435 family)